MFFLVRNWFYEKQKSYDSFWTWTMCIFFSLYKISSRKTAGLEYLFFMHFSCQFKELKKKTECTAPTYQNGISLIDFNELCYILTWSHSFALLTNDRASYPFGITSLAHAPVNVTVFSIGSINCVWHFPQT